MKKTFYAVICLTIMQKATISISNAQTNLKPTPANVTIDGDAKEWADFTPYENGHSKVNYTIRNDKDNLYLVVKTKDMILQSFILNWGGITFGIDTKGKKKATNSITFPIIYGTKPTLFRNNVEMQQAIAASKAKKIQVVGFKTISDEQITTFNTNGIKVAISYDADNNLVYEEAIPLALFNAGEQIDKQWAFNVKINGVDEFNDQTSNVKVISPGSNSMGRDPGTGQSPGFGRNTIPPIDFWVKFNLAKTP